MLITGFVLAAVNLQVILIALQLVPKGPYLPHQRIIVYDAETKQWSMRAYEDTRQGKTL
jgi:hypothetical protein